MMGKRAMLGAVGLVALGLTVAAGATSYGEWSAPVWAEALPGSSGQLNTPSNDGCPILNPYDGSLYIASNRPGGYGNLDIWIAPKNGEGWGTPVNAGPTINTAADEFCPTPARGNRFFFVRRVAATDTDIYVVKDLPKGGFQQPQRLPKGPGLINSTAEEWSPSWFEAPDGREFLYFASTRVAHPAQDIYYSVNLGPANLAPGGVNGSSSDNRPNVSRNGLEIVWDSNRFGGLGMTDIWTARRNDVDEPWGTAIHLGNGVNSSAVESRPSLSWDGTMLLFGSTRTPPGEGSADVYVSRRTR